MQRSLQRIGQIVFFLRPKNRGIHRCPSLYFSSIFFLQLLPSILFTTRLLPFHLSRLVSLKFPSGLQQPFLYFFSSPFPLRSRYISLFFPVFPSPSSFFCLRPFLFTFYFFLLLIFLRRGLCFRPLHFWPVAGLIRDFDAETRKSSIETNRSRGRERATVCGSRCVTRMK